MPSVPETACYKSAVQHEDNESGVAFHRCEDHAAPDFSGKSVAYTLLGFGRYRIPTKSLWVVLLLLLKFLLLPACGIQLDILPFVEIKW